ncbi:inorganic diphosphatase [Candidatus Gottesmanbacteria bacterium RBG_13_37_7]|uniref:Inorganic pyrophosphatase n=1 Tax=Candidatus Gottesmanbacteria bacterium RBG_13_37_7 TaxID=1798369 RepID=A0A1F5YJL5_9BACT|nr:MAG: inorganic diphosphatase [Candidatus Gottesmanbacteria bacterium RBG_13_37_7]
MNNMSFNHIPIGDKTPEIVNAVVEIPKGSHNKYEYDEDLEAIKLDRILHSPVYYPTDYGFIPQTRSEDGDHLDVLLIISEPVFPGCVVEVRPVGVLYMEDEAGKDEKIIAVAVNDPLLTRIKDVGDIDDFFKKEIHHFFEVYKALEKKKVKVHYWHAKEVAYTIISAAVERFLKEK